jgi:hypothetical protein
MFPAQLFEIVPVGRRPLFVEESGLGDDLGSGADAYDGRGFPSRRGRGRQLASIGAMIEEFRFAADSPLEREGFEPSVP